MSKRNETAAATRNQPARRAKRAITIIERAPVKISPRKTPARCLKRAISTTEANVIRRIKCEVSEVSTIESNVTHRNYAVPKINFRNCRGKYT